MTAEKFKRKLTAILSADVKGYSRLMGEDEEADVVVLGAGLAGLSAAIEAAGERRPRGYQRKTR